MYLKRVELQDWACHRSFAADFDSGLNVVEGPNGVGKSTLYRAIVTALTVKADSRGSVLADLAPWWTEGCGPRITLDLIRPDGAWRLHKTYLHSCKCELHGGSRIRDKVAEQKLLEWIDDDRVGGRLLLALWSEQHDSTQLIGALHAKAAAPATMLGQVLARTGEEERAGSFGAIKSVVTREHDRRFTPKDRRVKTGSDLDRARDDLEQAGRRWDEIEEKSAALERAIAALQACEDELRQATETLEATTREHAELVRRKEARRDHQAERDRLAADIKLAEKVKKDLEELDDQARKAIIARDEAAVAHEEARKLSLAREELRDEARRAAQTGQARLNLVEPLAVDLNHLADRLARLEEKAKQARERRRAVEKAEAALAAAIGGRDQARERLAGADEAHRAARWRHRRRSVLDAEAALRVAEDRLTAAEADRNRQDRMRVRERLDQIAAIRRDRAPLVKLIDGLPVPTGEDLEALRAEDREIGALDARLAADAIAMALTPETGLRFEVERDGEGESRTIAGEAGATVRIEAVSRLSVRIPGVGLVEISRAATEPARELERARVLRARRQARLEKFRATELADLERRHTASEQVRALDRNLATLLGDDTGEDLDARLRQMDDWFVARKLDPEPAATEPRVMKANTIEDLRNRHARALNARDIAAEALAAIADEDPGRVENRDEDPTIDESLVALRDHEARALEAKAAASKSLEQAERAVVGAESTRVSAHDELTQAVRSLEEEASGSEESTRDELINRIEGIKSQLVPLGFEDHPTTGIRTLLIRFHQKVKGDLAALERAARDADEEAGRAAREAAVAAADRESRAEAAAVLRDRQGDPELFRASLDEARRRAAVLGVEWKRLDDLLGPDPAAALEAVANRLAAEHQAVKRLTSQKDYLLGGLEGSEYARLDTDRAEVAERIARAEAEDRRCRVDAAAWALLRALIEEEERTHALQVSARLAALSSPTVARLTGNTIRELDLDERSLAPCRAFVGSDGLKVRIELFSRGTREQVALACRLEMARLLAAEARPMLLLDDPLAHTDPDRHREALSLFRELAQVAQLIIFTCHADRYAPLQETGPAGRIVLGRPDPP